ncbi:MAG TPA: ABC transporter permease [Caulobacteraceae bacterium]|jgi:putative spermidine/putrescine transport system permease protein
MTDLAFDDDDDFAPVPRPVADVVGFEAAVKKNERKTAIAGLIVIAPLLLFLLVNFLAPITLMLARGVQDREMHAALPQTAAALRLWDGNALPDEQLAATFVGELAKAKDEGNLSEVANRLNYDRAGLRTLLFHTADSLPATIAGSRLQALERIDPRWSDRSTWAVLKHAAGPLTSFYLLAAFDRRLDAAGHIVKAPADQAVFVEVLGRTLWISAVVTMLCLLLGYPLAYFLATLPQKWANPLMILVLLPFWTSTLVRTTAWIVLLQTHGVINDALMWTHLISKPLELVYNRTGVYVAMTHVLLPYVVLPLYAVMRGISLTPLRAALSLGATPTRAFWSIYAPQTVPGAAAGGLIVFVLSLGYYITPALVGGARDQMISYFIAFYTNQSLNWGMAAALGVVLLAATLVLMQFYGRLSGLRSAAWR